MVVLICLAEYLCAQQHPLIYTVKADSVKITNSCDTAELIIENHTQNVLGFLYNKGRDRTEFRKAVKLNDSTLVLGNDTVVIVGNTIANNGVSIADRYVQLGQAVGAAGNPAALSNHREIPLNGYNTVFTGTGNIGIGTSSPSSILAPTAKLHVKGEVMTYGTSGASSYIGLLDTNFSGNTYTTYLGYLNSGSYIASKYITLGWQSTANLSNTYLEFKNGNSDLNGGGISRLLVFASTDIYSNSSPAIASMIRFVTDGNERIRLVSSGRLGIGVSAPEAT